MSGDSLRGARKKQPVRHTNGEPINYASLSEGYDEDFDPFPGPHFECPICLLILRDPLQTDCGHRFCKRCILKTIREGRPNCPIDNQALTEKDLYPDNFAKRQILQFQTRCRFYKSNKCDWSGPFSKLQNHLDMCDYEAIDCPSGCDESIERQFLDAHLRDICPKRFIKCVYCEKDIVCNQKEKHESICLGCPVNCPKGCTVELTRGDLENHSLFCENEIIHCPFKSMGCPFQAKREGLNAHLADKLNSHLIILCERVSESTQFTQNIQPLATGVKLQPAVISNINKKIDTTMEEMERRINGAHSTAKEALDLRDNSNKRLIDLQKHISSTFSELSSRIDKQSEEINEMRSQLWNGRYVWCISGMEGMLNRSEHEPVPALHSQPFYSAHPGYKLCLRLNLGGVDSDAGDHIALFIHMMKGEYDSSLAWPLIGHFIIRIIDQTNDSSKQDIIEHLVAKPGLQAFKRPESQRNHKGYGYSEMIAHHVLRTNSYLKNGTMIISLNVEVQQTNKKPD